MVYLVHFGPISSTSVLFGLFGLIRSTLVLFGSFSPLWFYSVCFGPIQSIQSYLVQFSLIRFYSVRFGPFCRLQFNLVHFGPLGRKLSISVDIGLILPIRSNWVLFGPLYPPWSYWVHSIHFGPIRSYSVHFGSIRSILPTSVPFRLIWSALVLFGPFVSTLVHLVQFGWEKTGLSWKYSKSNIQKEKISNL